MSVSHSEKQPSAADFMREANSTNQIYSNEWQYQRSMKFKTEKAHTKPMKTSEELNSAPHPMFSMGSRRHYPEKLSESYKWKPHMKCVGPTDHSQDKPHVGMKKIIENYIIVKPKVERIGGQDDFEKLLNRTVLEKYSGVKQLAAK